jgi:hypothetical protein
MHLISMSGVSGTGTKRNKITDAMDVIRNHMMHLSKNRPTLAKNTM